jgi:mannose-6-phosphate isomerase-like protein (cupin superfamily)
MRRDKNDREIREVSMKGFNDNIEKETISNNYFRRVLYTGKQSQLVVMSLKPKEEIGLETHTENDQFLRFEGGSGTVIIDDNQYEVTDGDAVVVPAGARHNVINRSDTDALKIYTIYSPPHHKDGTIHKTKKDAETADEEFDGVTTE